MAEACIKGSAIVAVVEDLAGLIEAGKLSRDAIEARLEAADLEILDAKIQIALWYPIDSYERLLQILIDLEGGSDKAGYLRSRGRRTATRLAETGLYVQLRGDSKAATLDLAPVKRTLSLWNGMVSFSKWSCTQESDVPRVFRIDVSDAAKFPWVLRVSNAGFLEGVFSGIAQCKVSVALENEQPDRFVYRVRQLS